MSEILSPIIIEPQESAQYAVIWLHGLGANGHDFVPIVPELKLEDHAVRFIFPHAPHRGVTINGGMSMPAWYDIKGMDLADKEDRAGMQQSQAYLNTLIANQIEQGIAANRIVIAGFSQGGAVATYTLLRSEFRLAGCMALSTYVPFMSASAEERVSENTATPVFWGHGTMDAVVPLTLGQQSADHLRELGYPIEWHTYPMEHSVSAAEVNDISTWLKNCFEKASSPGSSAG